MALRTVLDLCDLGSEGGIFTPAQLQTNDTGLLEEANNISQAQNMVAGGLSFIFGAEKADKIAKIVSSAPGAPESDDDAEPAPKKRKTSRTKTAGKTGRK